MATEEVLFSGGLLPGQIPQPYKSIISYMSKGDALSAGDFDKTHLSKSHWLDVSKSKCIGKSKKPDPNCLFNIFGDLLDCDARSACEQAMAEVSDNFNYYTLAVTVVLSMRKQSLIDWLTAMRRYDTPGDEIVLYALSRMARIHSIVYSKTATWCTVAVAQPILPSDLHKACTVKLMFLGKRGFGELVQKPSYSMPVYYPDIHRESIYNSGYYEEINKHPEVTPPTQGSVNNNPSANETTSTIGSIKDVVLSSVIVPDQEVMTDKNIEQDFQQDNSVAMDTSMLESKVDGETSVDTGLDTGDTSDHLLIPILDFPSSSSVCTTTPSSALQNFNPLEESEPNLELEVTDENSYRQDPIITNDNLIDDAKTKIWKVSVRKLTLEEVEFLSGSKLLPGLGTNVHDIELMNNSDQAELAENNDSETTIVMSETEHDNKTINSNVIPSTGNLARPKRKCTEKTEKSSELSAEDDDDRDDDYLPKDSPKRRPKPRPSASRISARNYDKTHKTANTNTKSTTKDKNSDDNAHDGLKHKNKEKVAKGKISIKMFGIPKKTKERKMKCPSCPKICSSTKERNEHHKEKHGKLTCAVCNEVFDTPSALDKHKYKHVEQKFKCADCGEAYPFESQLKEHRMKHRTGKSFQCMSSKCGKWFKIESSLKKHVLTHDGVMHKCKAKRGCEYENIDIRSVRAHEKTHSDKKAYGCDKCGETFKYWMQMNRHFKDNKCPEIKNDS